MRIKRKKITMYQSQMELGIDIRLMNESLIVISGGVLPATIRYHIS